jgi:hypothetical protein
MELENTHRQQRQRGQQAANASQVWSFKSGASSLELQVWSLEILTRGTGTCVLAGGGSFESGTKASKEELYGQITTP